MSVTTVKIERIGIYRKLRNKTAEIGAPCLLNEDPRRYGVLEGEDQMDLKKGCEGLKDEGYGDLFHSYFDYVMKSSTRGIPLKKAIGANFVTTRRTLLLLANMAFYKSSFVIRAVRKQGVIFLCDANSEDVGPCGELFEGHKFNQYMTLKDNGEPYDDYEPVSNAECTRAVLRSSFMNGNKEIKVAYTAVIDAHDKDGNFVEIKSSKLGFENWIQKRSLAHYLQAHFGTMSHIIHGETDDDKMVKRVTKIAVDSIPKMDVFWKPEKCFLRVFETLLNIESRLTLDDTALVIRRDGWGINVERGNESDCKFVDPEFLRYFE